MLHQSNLFIHVMAGTIALVIGAIAIFSVKPSSKHFRFGRYFLCLISIVVATGFIGFIFFRSNPFLLMLTLLSGYVSYAGYRSIRLKEQRATTADMLIACTTLITGLVYLFWLLKSDKVWAPSVVLSTLVALVLVTSYDLLKGLWLYEKLKKYWLYEHIYKMLSAYSAILSAFSGTVLANFKPYSQIGPSSLMLMLIAFYIVKNVRRNRKKIIIQN